MKECIADNKLPMDVLSYAELALDTAWGHSEGVNHFMGKFLLAKNGNRERLVSYCMSLYVNRHGASTAGKLSLQVCCIVHISI